MGFADSVAASFSKLAEGCVLTGNTSDKPPRKGYLLITFLTKLLEISN
jgi:hypothetical protein